jgi:hypothetical protein
VSLIGGLFAEHALAFVKRNAEKVFGKTMTAKKAGLRQEEA